MCLVMNRLAGSYEKCHKDRPGVLQHLQSFESGIGNRESGIGILDLLSYALAVKRTEGPGRSSLAEGDLEAK
jgi:hypothetical protein